MADGEGKEVEGEEAGKEGAGEEGEEGAEEEGAGENGEEGAGENGETKKITQKILATMADFLDGEVHTYNVLCGGGSHDLCSYKISPTVTFPIRTKNNG